MKNKPDMLKLIKPVVESKRHIAFYVGEDHCSLGKPDSRTNCALALAAKDELKGLVSVEIFRRVAYFEFKTHIERFIITGNTQAMVRRFDKTGAFDPGLYQFSPMIPSWTLKRHRTANRIKRTGAPPTRRRLKKGTHFARPRGNGEFGVVMVPAPDKPS